MDYINKRKQELLNTFNDYEVVLVEVISDLQELNGTIFAISEQNFGFSPLQIAIDSGCFVDNKEATIAVTAKCIDLMDKIQKQNMPVIPQTKFAKFIESHFGCVLAVFISIIIFILFCIGSMFVG